MKIYIDDGLSLAKFQKTGIGIYTRDLALCLNHLGYQTFLANYKKFFLGLSVFFQRIFYLFSVNKLAFTKKYDVIFYTNAYVPPFKHKAKVIVTIHDLSIINYPETFSEYYLIYARKALLLSMKYSDEIVVPSNSVKYELLKLYPFLENKVHVVYNILRKQIINHKSYTKIDYGQTVKFLFVGVVEKRKNLKLLCSAFKKLYALNKNVELLIVGKSGYGFDEIATLFDEKCNIFYKEYVSDDELTQIYLSTSAFVFPSLYEGFGIPIIEAMSFGLPIIASNIPTNMELNKRHNSNFYIFDKNNEEDLVQKMEILIHNNDKSKCSYDHLSLYSYENVSLMYKRIIDRL